MPRLNHGTLLENIVLLGVTRAALEYAQGNFEFASSFSMPPLTQSWHNNQIEKDQNLRFNSEIMTNIIERGENPNLLKGSYESFLSKCLLNQQNIETCDYVKPVHQSFKFSSANGALLVGMLTLLKNRKVRMWLNDLGAQQGRYYSPGYGSEHAMPLVMKNAEGLLGLNRGQPLAAVNLDSFPGCIDVDSLSHVNLQKWVEPCKFRIAFLDPDGYVGNDSDGDNKIDAAQHVRWLKAVNQKCTFSISVMFFFESSASQRHVLITQFHQDEYLEFPHSLVFRIGNFLTGVKISNFDANLDLVNIIKNTIRESWESWNNGVVNQPPNCLSLTEDGQDESAWGEW